MVQLLRPGQGSGVAETRYSLDGVIWNAYLMPFTISDEGESTVYYRSTDNAGNTEMTQEQIVKIDKTPPTITGAANTSRNANEWYNSDVTINFTASDTLSGIDTIKALRSMRLVSNAIIAVIWMKKR